MTPLFVGYALYCTAHNRATKQACVSSTHTNTAGDSDEETLIGGVLIRANDPFVTFCSACEKVIGRDCVCTAE